MSNMADVEPKPTATSGVLESPQLKRLGFLQQVAVGTINYANGWYTAIKKNIGPLKGPVEQAENTLKYIASPLYKRVETYVPTILTDVDSKVDTAVSNIENTKPYELSKQVYASQLGNVKAIYKTKDEFLHRIDDTIQGLRNFLNQQVEKAGSPYNLPRYFVEQAAGVVQQAQKDGVGTTVDKAVAGVQFYSYKVWDTLAQIPVFKKVLSTVAPAGFYVAEKYNSTVAAARDDTRVGKYAGYVPMVPLDSIKEEVDAKLNGVDKSAAPASSE
eukprot:jgi/Chlat1/7413/Chrsp6S07436